jgi:hypothetical protein
MSSLFFWNQWFKEYRITWLILAAVFIFSMLFMWYGYFRGPDNVIKWENLQEQQVIESTVHSFRLGPFVMEVPAESYAILEHLQGSRVHPNVNASYVFLAVISLALIVIIAIITTLEKLWFYIAVALLSVFLFSLRLEVLGIFGLYHKVIGISVIALYLLPSFYFNRISPSTPFVIRLLVYLLVTIFLGFIIGFFSKENYPFYHLVLTSFTGTLILSLIFLILVSNEIFASFVYIASKGSSKSIQHLAILSTIYFVNLLLTLAHELQLIQFDFIYLNTFLLLTVSAILGIWGFRSREVIYENLFPFHPFGGYLFLALGALCFATIGNLAGNANDPGVHVIRHAVLFTQAGYGIIFLLYVLSNFGQMLSDNGPVYKVLYLPKRMPYFTFGLAGFIATIAIFIFSGWHGYVYNSMSAFYNSAGDFYMLQGDERYAYSFYLKGSSQGAMNHRSNYALAMLNASGYNFEEAHNYMEYANVRRPSEYSLTNAGNLFVRENKIKESIAAYRRSLERVDGVPAIENNIAVSYIKLHRIDSAIYFLSRAREQALTKSAAETNFFALTALEVIPINSDSVYRAFGNSSPAVLSNVYALSTVLKTPLKIEIDPLATQQLDLYTATYLNNYILRNIKDLDTAFTSKAYRIASDPANSDFSEALKASLAYAFYHQGNIARALEILAEQVYVSQSYQGKFNYIMGLWALEQGNPEVAATYFGYADTYEYKDARFYHAIALTESGDIHNALSAWDSVAIHGDDGQKAVAGSIREILTLPPSEAMSLKDAEKYQFCRYRINSGDSTLFDRIASTFSNDNYLAQALLDYSKRFLEAGEIIPSIRYYQKIAGLKLTNEKLYEEVRHFELRLLAYRGEMRGVATQINKGLEFDKTRNLEKLYYAALMSEANGDTITAERNYSILARYNPYFEEGVMSAYKYFKKKNASGFEAYNILAEAIQINANSLPLLRTYQQEAMNVGLDEYAMNARQKIAELESRIR